jgi:glycosyltransferase involved in cell wall biosynthesis
MVGKYMKIVFVGTRLQVNGATKVAVQHSNRLHILGHEIRFVVHGFERLDWCSPLFPIEYSERLKNIKVDNDEIVVALDGFVTNWFIRNIGVKRVVSLIQVDEPELYCDTNLKKASEEAFKMNNPKIVVSKYLKEILLKRYGVRSEVVPPGVSFEIFYPIKRTPPKKKDKFRVLMVGSYSHPLKGVHIGYSALEHLSSMGEEVHLMRLVRKQENAKPRGIPTEWFINPSQDAIGDIYRKADVLLCSSSSEGFGLPLVEAMASGVPVVATDNGGVRDIISSSRYGLIVPVGNERRIAEALYRLRYDQQLWISLRMAGLRHAKKWSVNNSCQLFEKYILKFYREANMLEHAK